MRFWWSHLPRPPGNYLFPYISFTSSQLNFRDFRRALWICESFLFIYTGDIKRGAWAPLSFFFFVLRFPYLHLSIWSFLSSSFTASLFFLPSSSFNLQFFVLLPFSSSYHSDLKLICICDDFFPNLWFGKIGNVC